jgi:hypothetical protein
VVYSLDRLSRNHSQILLLVDELRRLGVAIHLAKHDRVMGRTASDSIADAVEAHFAEIEHTSIVERTAEGRRAKIRRGHYPGTGQPPYGYRVAGREPDTQLVIDEEQAVVVRMIFQLIGRSSANRRSVKPYLSYVCGGRKGNVRPCTMRPVSVPVVDTIVWAWMKELVANPNAMEAAHAHHAAVQAQRLEALEQEREQLYGQKVEHEQALSRLVDLYTRGSLPIELLDVKAAELRELLRVLQEAIEHNERHRQTVIGDDRNAALRTFAQEHQRRIADAEHDFVARRQLVELLDVRMQVVLRGDEHWLKLTSILGEGRKRLDLPPRKQG